MFFHNYKYRLKCIVRDKSMMFWTLFFPIILAILFNLALGNIGSADNFKPINLAVVKNSSYEGEKEFTKVLDEVSDKKRDDVVFNTQYVSKNKAEKLLEDNKVEGYIFFDDDINIVVNKSGLNQTIIKSFVDETSVLLFVISQDFTHIIYEGKKRSIISKCRNHFLSIY